MTSAQRKLITAAAVVLLVVAAGTLLFQQIPETVSAPLFVLVVIIEVVIAPIPGGAIGYLGAARFGFWQAWPLLYIGNVIGTTLVFYLARRLGAPLFEELVSDKARGRYNDKLQNHPFLLWLAYTVPVLPVDVLSVLAGLSNISAKRFFLTAFSGYFFYTAIVAYVGSSLAEFIGVTDALSILGAVLLLGLVLWIWKQGSGLKRSIVRVALTGNIASGKSAVADVWREAGATVIDADDLARDAVAPGTEGFRRVQAEFGPAIIAADGGVDRAALRALVFADDVKRQRLEDILHPEIEQLRIAAEDTATKRGARVVVHAIPLLFETGLDDQFDVIVLVDAPGDVRRARIVSTRGLSEDVATAMIAAQMPAAEKRPRSHHVIENTGTLADLKAEAMRVWSRIGGAT